MSHTRFNFYIANIWKKTYVPAIYAMQIPHTGFYNEFIVYNYNCICIKHKHFYSMLAHTKSEMLCTCVRRYMIRYLPQTGSHPVAVVLTIVTYIYIYRCPRRNVPNFGRVFLRLKYTDITQNTYIQS